MITTTLRITSESALHSSAIGLRCCWVIIAVIVVVIVVVVGIAAHFEII